MHWLMDIANEMRQERQRAWLDRSIGCAHMRWDVRLLRRQDRRVVVDRRHHTALITRR
jgi:hypothetical protein